MAISEYHKSHKEKKPNKFKKIQFFLNFEKKLDFLKIKYMFQKFIVLK